MSNQLHAGKLRGKGRNVWHCDNPDEINPIYWCGSCHNRTAKELYSECKSIMKDLKKNHPKLPTEEEQEKTGEEITCTKEAIDWNCDSVCCQHKKEIVKGIMEEHQSFCKRYEQEAKNLLEENQKLKKELIQKASDECKLLSEQTKTLRENESLKHEIEFLKAKLRRMVDDGVINENSPY